MDIATILLKAALTEEVIFLIMNSQLNNVRIGIKDVWWHSYMVQGADFSHSKFDIPYCPTTTMQIPCMIITFDEAKRIYRRQLLKGNKDFLHMAYVCFYEDDHEFDSKNGIWFNSSRAYRILCHFAGIITPDFSTYQDFPIPLKYWNTYRMRAYGYWYGTICGHAVINNVRWGTPETYSYCFDGIPKNSIVAIGTVGGSPRKLIDRERFEKGLFEMVRVLLPHTIIVYGSANYPCFDKLCEQGINIVAYPSRKALAFDRRQGK